MSGIDLIETARAAVFTALAAGVAGTGAAARDHVKQDTPPPFVQLGEIEWANEGGKDEIALRLTIEVTTIYRGADRAELLAIMHAVFLALHGVALVADGVVLGKPELIGGAASNAGPDGVTYAGLQSFEIFAEPA